MTNVRRDIKNTHKGDAAPNILKTDQKRNQKGQMVHLGTKVKLFAKYKGNPDTDLTEEKSTSSSLDLSTSI